MNLPTPPPETAQEDHPLEPALWDDWGALEPLSAKAIEYLEQHGIDFEARQRAGEIAMTRARLTGRLWAPDPGEGVAVYVLKVMAGEVAGPRNPDKSILLSDLLAFNVATRRWWLRDGCGGVLGLENLDRASVGAAGAMGFTCPIAWLRFRCCGFCDLRTAELYRSP